MTYKYLPKNVYELSPKYAEQVVKDIMALYNDNKQHWEQLGVKLSTTTGCIDGMANEYDETSTIRDTVVIEVNGEILGKLIVNGTTLLREIPFGLPLEDFIQVTFGTGITETELLKCFIRRKVPLLSNALGQKFYNFMILHKDDLDVAGFVVLKKLEAKILEAQKNLQSEIELFIDSVKKEYTQYL